MTMKIFFIFFAILLVLLPYTMSNKNIVSNPVTTTRAGPATQCLQKAPLTASIRCNFSQAYVIPTELSLSKTHSLMGLLSFSLYLLSLCSGFTKRIYKPPRSFSNN
ncbi:hypothetical protein LEAN103870_14375 [Legionella anisa]|uniref:Uncharacterized protein n=3 Tax=Legionella anisa TaxID=28082 RepID=A0AAX0WS35_9GAMM|nr:hypothetical protein [Legionella anisa]AWN74749.1 hypothetical protein DLD14_13370 [Legionella anisa]KTC77546.1 hypothetical protein Lani_0104 [Legionella anisa]MBN5934892.1 hypothetical protein [Legionella anisa]PNL61356.1 hypothetical protein A6J39_009100 [Legionella anisa]UAK79900.1 hypothetical protein K8O89_02100 [Legionella anisa]